MQRWGFFVESQWYSSNLEIRDPQIQDCDRDTTDKTAQSEFQQLGSAQPEMSYFCCIA
jgi:hypothetical protein